MNAQFNTLALRRVFFLLAIALITVGGCKKEKKKNEVKFNNIVATGDQEVPTPVTTSATATMNATYDKDSKIITYSLTFSGLNPTHGYFQKGAVGTTGLPVIDLKPTYGFVSPITNSVTRALTSEEEADLLAGNWYYNLQTNNHPDGEIRGQMKAN